MLVASGQQVVAVEILDPRELELPDGGVLSLVDPGDRPPRRGRHALQPRCAARSPTPRRSAASSSRPTLRRAGARHAVVRTDGDWLRDLGSHLA